MKKPQFNIINNIDSIIRVNHAGEFGAKNIYEGQIKGLGKSNNEIQEMYHQELVHLDYFESLMVTRKVRPTILMPFWEKLGFALGYITGKMGLKEAMICTESVEEVIDRHYEDQVNYLSDNRIESDLKNKILKFQAEEVEHKNLANNYIIIKSFTDNFLSIFIKIICKISISLSKKI
jgi:ubiquinone biosynthesis monooxygenase Coq7